MSGRRMLLIGGVVALILLIGGVIFAWPRSQETPRKTTTQTTATTTTTTQTTSSDSDTTEKNTQSEQSSDTKAATQKNAQYTDFDLDRFQKSEVKYRVLVFTAAGNTSGQQLDTLVRTHLAELTSDVEAFRVDLVQHYELADYFGVKEAGTALAFDQSGSMIGIYLPTSTPELAAFRQALSI